MNHVSKPASIILVVLAGLIIGGITLAALSYHSSEFKGGIGIRDSGFFSYPRFHVQIGELPLWKDGEYQFRVQGLPPDKLDLSLQVEGANDTNRTELTSLSTIVRLSILDSFGNKLCAADGVLSNAKNREHDGWVLASSAAGASFWQSSCQQIPISRFKTYIIKVTVSQADPRSPQMKIMTVLEGGGNELP